MGMLPGTPERTLPRKQVLVDELRTPRQKRKMTRQSGVAGSAVPFDKSLFYEANKQKTEVNFDCATESTPGIQNGGSIIHSLSRSGIRGIPRHVFSPQSTPAEKTISESAGKVSGDGVISP